MKMINVHFILPCGMPAGHSNGARHAPVILNLDGNGIQVTPVTSWNTYYDMAGDGRQHRTD